MIPKAPNDEDLSTQAATTMGRKGGQAGSGAKKRRDTAHYRHKLVEARLKAKLKRKLKS